MMTLLWENLNSRDSITLNIMSQCLKKFTINLDDKIHAELRKEAFDREISIKDIILEALEFRKKSKKKSK